MSTNASSAPNSSKPTATTTATTTFSRVSHLRRKMAKLFPLNRGWATPERSPPPRVSTNLMCEHCGLMNWVTATVRVLNGHDPTGSSNPISLNNYEMTTNFVCGNCGKMTCNAAVPIKVTDDGIMTL